jgi:PAS domain S-box-containing protein
MPIPTPSEPAAIPSHELVERISDLEEDIRNLRRLQLTIERNNTLFEALIASSHDGIALTRLDGTMIRVVRSIVGYGSTELTGTSIYDLVHADDRDNMREHYARFAKGLARQIVHQTRLLRPDGSFLWVQGTMTDMIDNPAVQAIVHNYRNITLLKAGEVASAELAAVIRYAPFATFSKSMTGEILSWNDGAAEMFGYRCSEIIGRHISVLIPPELQLEEERIRALVLQQRAPTAKLRTTRLRKDGGRLPIELVLSPLITGTCIHGVAHLSYAVTQPRHAE